MQVTVESGTGLERTLKVEIPEERIRGEVDRRLGDLARSIRVPGFRPGKAPIRVVAQRFGRQVRDEVVGEMVQSSFFDALSQEKLRPAGSPSIEPVESRPGEGLAYTATFDVFPEVDLPPIESLEIKRPEAAVADADVERMIETLRRQRTVWTPVERAARETDRVVIDFEGRVGDTPIDGGDQKEFTLELDGGRMIPGFEDGIVGAAPGEEREVRVTFPADYRAEELAGKEATFAVKVHRVEESSLPDVDDEFAASFGIAEGGAEALRAEVRSNMERELEDGVRTALKNRVMEALVASRDLDLPESMVREEVQRAFERREAEIRQAGVDPQAVGLDPSMFEEEARRRVALGLLVAELIKVNGIEADAQRVRERIERIASTYQEPGEVLNWYYSDRSRLSEIESLVLEEQVVDWILERANVTPEPTTFDRLLNPGQSDDAG